MNTTLKLLPEKYLESVEDLAKENSSVVFFNSDFNHAAIVMGTIFKYSNDTLKIFAGNLQHDFCQSDRYIFELESFIKRGEKVQILFDELNGDKLPDSKISNILKKYLIAFPHKIEIRKTMVMVVDSKTKQKVHFTTADNKSYRIENDTVNFTAKCCFNDSEKAKSLNLLFDKIFQDANKSVKVTF